MIQLIYECLLSLYYSLVSASKLLKRIKVVKSGFMEDMFRFKHSCHYSINVSKTYAIVSFFYSVIITGYHSGFYLLALHPGTCVRMPLFTTGSFSLCQFSCCIMLEGNLPHFVLVISHCTLPVSHCTNPTAMVEDGKLNYYL